MVSTRFQRPDVALTYPEAEAERLARTRREAMLVAKAEAAIAAGLGIGEADLLSWLDALDRDDNTPLPERPDYGPSTA